MMACKKCGRKVAPRSSGHCIHCEVSLGLGRSNGETYNLMSALGKAHKWGSLTQHDLTCLHVLMREKCIDHADTETLAMAQDWIMHRTPDELREFESALNAEDRRLFMWVVCGVLDTGVAGGVLEITVCQRQAERLIEDACKQIKADYKAEREQLAAGKAQLEADRAALGAEKAALIDARAAINRRLHKLASANRGLRAAAHTADLLIKRLQDRCHDQAQEIKRLRGQVEDVEQLGRLVQRLLGNDK